MRMRYILFVGLLLWSTITFAQSDSLLVTYESFIQQVYTTHPIALQIQLKRQEAATYLQKAKGGFDPKLGSKWDFKQFDEKNYFNILNAHLKVPIWAGIEAEGGYNYTTGYYLNPENKLPSNGQAYLGIKVPLLKGLWTNERQLAVQQAKVNINANEAMILSQLNDLLYEAGKTYWNWSKVYNTQQVVQASLENAQQQFEATKASYIQGDLPAIDTLKAFIRIQDRELLLTNAILEVENAARQVSMYLWTAEQTPLSLPAGAFPVLLQEQVSQPLDAEVLTNSLQQLDAHPAIQWYDYKLTNLDLERKMRVNQLLPKLDVKYNFLSTDHVDFFGVGAAAPIEQYKLGVKFSMPIFLRKERAKLRLVKLKQQAVAFKLSDKQRSLKIKIENYFNQVQSFAQQTVGLEQMITNYETLLEAERIKLTMGESSVFMVNTRENQLLNARLKLIKQQIEYLKARTAFFWSVAGLTPN